MAEGRTLKQVLESLDEREMDKVAELLRDMGYIDCCGCGLWFTESEYDFSHEYPSDNLCGAHQLPCNKLLAKDDRFYDEYSVKKAALDFWKKEFPESRALVLGSSGVADPQLVLAGPKEFKKVTNSLYRKMKEFGGYEGNEQECLKISNEYDNFLNSYNFEDSGENNKCQ